VTRNNSAWFKIILKNNYLPSYVVVEPWDHVDRTVYFRQGDIHVLAFSFEIAPLDPNDSKTKKKSMMECYEI